MQYLRRRPGLPPDPRITRCRRLVFWMEGADACGAGDTLVRAAFFSYALCQVANHQRLQTRNVASLGGARSFDGVSWASDVASTTIEFQ